jgi:hypothetical protein
MNARRWKELLAIGMVGEGVLAMFFPTEHLSLWHVGPGPMKRAIRYCEERPGLTRLLATMEAGFGFWLASRQFDRRNIETRPVAKTRRKLQTTFTR